MKHRVAFRSKCKSGANVAEGDYSESLGTSNYETPVPRNNFISIGFVCRSYESRFLLPLRNDSLIRESIVFSSSRYVS